MRRLAFVLPAILCLAATGPSPEHHQIDAPPHRYHERTPRDRFTALKDDLEAGRLTVDQSSEKAFLESLLRVLEIPASSQMLVFSTTSLQLRLITPANPRALYFNEEIYLGWVPGGSIEVLSLDPELGAIFYIFAPPRNGAPVRVERSNKCMNCHSADDTGGVPGLVVKSVLSGERGGSLKTFRIEQSGHQVPFTERFGGWYLTGDTRIANVLGNVVGRYVDGELRKFPIEPGRLFDFARYPVLTSDPLPQLVHEHQAGFVNRVIEAGYRARTYLHAGNGRLSTAHGQALDEQARIVTRYLLFADEAPLPAGGLRGDTVFQTDFLKTRRPAQGGRALKDFDLQTRLFRYRCSYMIYSPIFSALPGEMKKRVYQELSRALHPTAAPAEYSYLPAAEKSAIRTILRSTLPEAASWL